LSGFLCDLCANAEEGAEFGQLAFEVADLGVELVEALLDDCVVARVFVQPTCLCPVK
jgi:hypothetical protein